MIKSAHPHALAQELKKAYMVLTSADLHVIKESGGVLKTANVSLPATIP